MSAINVLRRTVTGALLFGAMAGSSGAGATTNYATVPADGIFRVRSDFGFAETVARIKAKVAALEIRLFAQIDQAALAPAAGVELGRSTLLLFGNPPLGLQFLTANPFAGLEWPVRMLVTEDDGGAVWIAWPDFEAIGKRYGIADRGAVIAKANMVAGMIAGTAAEREH